MTTKRVLVTLPYPTSANRMYTHTKRGVFMSPEGKAFKQEAQTRVPDVIRFVYPPTYPVAVEIHVYRPQKSGDLDNRIKIAMDAMNGILWADDAQITEIHAYRHEAESKETARIELAVSEAIT